MKTSHPKLLDQIRTPEPCIKCGHLNVNGLFHKLEEVRLLLRETKFDIFAITETHLNEKDHDDDDIEIDDYLFYRNDRKANNSWGGVIVYYKSSLVIDQLEIKTNIESIWMEGTAASQKYIIACIYRPPKMKKFLEGIDTILNRFDHRFNVFLLGDFNIDLSEDTNTLTKDFNQVLAGHSLSNVIMNYTRITASSQTLIDLAITSNPTKVIKKGTYAMGLSDHDLIFMNIKLRRQTTKPRLIYVRNYKNIDTVKLDQDLETCPWHIISIFDDVDDSLWCWEYLFKNVLSSHVTTRKVKVRNNNQPWMNGEVRKAINDRYKLLNKARGTPKDSKEWKDYKKAKNKCTNIIRATKVKYWKNEFDQCDSIKNFWSLVKKFKGQSKNNYIGPLKDHEQSTVTEDIDKANTMNSFFANIGKKLATPPQTDENGSLNTYIYRVTPTVDKISFSKELLENSFKAAVKIGKACGPDSITAKDLSLNSEMTINGLQHVVNCSLSSGKFPTSWKKSKVTAIFKKGSKSDCSNYRPISLLSIPSKIVEHLVCTQLTSHLREHSLESEHQWGFRPQRSTEDILLYMTEKWRKSIDSGKTVGTLFIDFRKAFDTVSHQILLKKMCASGISGDFLSYIESYLSDRLQSTIINGIESTCQPVEFGVPQGSLIGPPSFSINVNDMSESVDCDLDQLADDSTAYTTGENTDLVLQDLQHSVTQLESYSKKNSLTIHPDKCKVLVLSKHQFIGPFSDFHILNKSIDIVKSTKCLGVIIDDNLKWDIHVQKATMSFSVKVKKLYEMRGMSKSTLSTIYFKGILPSVLYGILIWGNCSPTLLSKVEKVHIRAARFINRVKKSVPDIYVLSRVGWKEIIYYYKKSIACKVYKIYNGLSSPLLSGLIEKSDSRKNRNSFKINQPSFKYVDQKRSFNYRAAIVWNNIPLDIRQKDSYDAFKKALKKSDCLEKVNFHMAGRALLYQDYIYY